MTGWVDAVDLDVGRAPATRELPQAYPADTAMDISHVFAPYRSQLDGSAYAEANCGPTAVGMALDAFGVSVPPRQLRAEALDAQHMYGNGVGTLITALAQVVAAARALQALDLRDDDGAMQPLEPRRHSRRTSGGASRSSSRCAIGRCPGAAARTTSATTTSWSRASSATGFCTTTRSTSTAWAGIASSAAPRNAMNASARYAYAVPLDGDAAAYADYEVRA